MLFCQFRLGEGAQRNPSGKEFGFVIVPAGQWLMVAGDLIGDFRMPGIERLAAVYGAEK